MFVSWNAALRAGDFRLRRGRFAMSRGLMSGVPSGAFGLTNGGGAGNFPATASASHSSMVLPDGALTAAAASCSLLTLTAVERSFGPARGTAEQLPKAA
uniref:Uncharacterized protein n=1 Tax=Arundo donax TaxID=35708 RepID=A0A0A9CMD5_ARUDO